MKSTDFEIRTASLSADEKKLTGYAVKWNSRSQLLWGEFIETFAPYAFKNSLGKETDVRCLFEYDVTNLLGRTASSTLQLAEDETGLRFALTPPDTQLGRDVLTLVERGDISGMSFAFRTIKDHWEIGEPHYLRTVIEAELLEITITSLPAYPESGVEIAKRSLNVNRSKPTYLHHRWLQLSEVE